MGEGSKTKFEKSEVTSIGGPLGLGGYEPSASYDSRQGNIEIQGIPSPLRVRI